MKTGSVSHELDDESKMVPVPYRYFGLLGKDNELDEDEISLTIFDFLNWSV